jgi:hypothetical protein
MVDRMQRAGIGVATNDEALLAEAEEVGKQGGAAAPAAAAAGGGGDAEKQAQIAANRARMAAMAQKK